MPRLIKNIAQQLQNAKSTFAKAIVSISTTLSLKILFLKILFL